MSLRETAFVASVAVWVCAATSLAGVDFTTGPEARAEAGGARITFGVSGTTDVEVAIVDAAAGAGGQDEVTPLGKFYIVVQLGGKALEEVHAPLGQPTVHLRPPLLPDPRPTPSRGPPIGVFPLQDDYILTASLGQVIRYGAADDPASDDHHLCPFSHRRLPR